MPAKDLGDHSLVLDRVERTSRVDNPAPRFCNGNCSRQQIDLQIMQRPASRGKPFAPDIRVLTCSTRSGAGCIDQYSVETRLGNLRDMPSIVIDHRDA